MIRAAFGAVLALLLAACATSFAPLRYAPDDPRPRLLLEGWLESARQRVGLRGLARLAVDGSDGEVRLRGKQLVVLRRPANLRVEVLGFLNQSLAVLVTDGRHFEIQRAEEHAYEAGEVDADWLWNETGIALRPEEAVAVLLGAPIGAASLIPAAAHRDARGLTHIELVDRSGTARQRVRFDSEGRLHALELLDGLANVLWSARFREYRDVGGAPFAHAIQLDVSAGSTRAEISFRDVELNPDLPADIFRLSSPGPNAGRGS